jgi:hypothetical protein
MAGDTETQPIEFVFALQQDEPTDIQNLRMCDIPTVMKVT